MICRVQFAIKVMMGMNANGRDTYVLPDDIFIVMVLQGLVLHQHMLQSGCWINSLLRRVFC